MKNLKNVLFMSIFVFLFSFSFSFAQVEDTVDEVTEDVVESVELESEDTLDLGEERENIEDSDLSGLEWVSIVSQQVDEESDIELYEEEGNDDSMDVDVEIEEGLPEIAYLSLWFCNNWLEDITHSLNTIVTEWTPYKVCIVITNDSKEDIDVNLGFFEARPDPYWNLACYAEEWFREYVVNSDEISQFNVPAWNYIVKEAEILFPVWISENQAWCFGIWATPKEVVWEGGWLSIVPISRKSQVASFYIWSLDNIVNELNISHINTYMNDDGEVMLAFDVENLWNLENEFVINWKIKNIFGFSRDVSSTKENSTVDNVIAWHKSSVEVNFWRIPNYGWLYSIEFEVVWTPYFNFDLSDDFDKSLLEPLTYTEKTTYFEMPWLICIIVVIVIILLIVLFRKPKPQVVYVQAPQQPQQPQPQYQQPQYQNPQYQQPVNNQVPQQPKYQQPQQPMQQ